MNFSIGETRTFSQIQVGFKELEKRRLIGTSCSRYNTDPGIKLGFLFFVMLFCYFEYSAVKKNLWKSVHILARSQNFMPSY